MGDVADDILNGLMCEQCGVWMPDVERLIGSGGDKELNAMFENPPGFLRRCPDCLKDGGSRR